MSRKRKYFWADTRFVSYVQTANCSLSEETPMSGMPNPPPFAWMVPRDERTMTSLSENAHLSSYLSRAGDE
jgi:hypothetical protein